MPTTQFFNANIFKDHEFKKGELWVRDSKIISPATHTDAKIDLKGAMLAPGYIDLQVNGSYGHDFTSDPSSVPLVAAKLPQTGVTSFLPTIVSTISDNYKALLKVLYSAINESLGKGATPIGIHLEGPFINPKYAGAHDVKAIRGFSDLKSLQGFYGSFTGIKMVTLAPELENALTYVKELVDRGIIVSIGHSDADLKTTQQALKQGASLITHLYNAMAPFHHREPGIIGAVLSNPPVFYSIIADNIHVSPEALKLAWSANKEGLILITDAMAAQGMQKGKYKLANKDVEVTDTRAYLEGTQTLAGSVVTMDEAVRNLWKATRCTKAEAIEAASVKPAQLLGLTQKGNLDEGSDADFIVLSDDLRVQSTYIAGKKQIFTTEHTENTEREREK